jgi:regulator of sigma E protease
VQGEAPNLRVREASLEHLGETIPMVIEREGTQLEFDVALNEKAPALGVGFDLERNYIEVSPIEAIKEGVTWPLIQTRNQLAGLAAMITGQSTGEVGGPSAIVKTIKGSVDHGWIDFLQMAALISTVLGLFNILPLPALDGGRLMFMFYEVIFRRRANANVEGWVHGIGILLLLGFIGFVEVRAAARAVTDDTPSFLQRSPEIFERALHCQSVAREVPPMAPPAAKEN